MHQPKRYCVVEPKECNCKTGQCLDKALPQKKKKGSK